MLKIKKVLPEVPHPAQGVGIHLKSMGWRGGLAQWAGCGGPHGGFRDAVSKPHDSLYGSACDPSFGRLPAHVAHCAHQQCYSRIYCGFSGGSSDVQACCHGVEGHLVALAQCALVAHAHQGHLLSEGNWNDGLSVRHVMGGVAVHDGFMEGRSDEAVVHKRG